MKKPQFLTGNMLKLLAAFSMLLDHAGLLFFPSEMGFRIAGRLAFPIFAFMIAEGCKYTRSPGGSVPDRLFRGGGGRLSFRAGDLLPGHPCGLGPAGAAEKENPAHLAVLQGLCWLLG